MYPSVMVDNVEHLDIVPKNKPMNPETEDLLSADEIRNDMMILSSPEYRVDENSMFLDAEILKKNRWCMVTKKRTINDVIWFIAIYEDGQKEVRFTDRMVGWI